MNSKERDTLILLVGLFVGVGATLMFSNAPHELTGSPQSDGRLPVAVGQELARLDTTSRSIELQAELPEFQAAPDEPRRAVVREVLEPDLAGFIDILPTEMPSDAELERRYGDMGGTELQGALRSLNFVVHSEAKAFLEKKFQRGIFTTQVVAHGTLVNQPMTFPDGAPRATMAKWSHRNDGFSEVSVAEIHPTEQPILAARHAEIAWVALRAKSVADN
ncbi:MAG: hypothetical protein ACI8X5_000984 [Planctomycetota bacterium]|jgi:hypothetical protein